MAENPRIPVLYHSSYNHIEQMAEAVAAGTRLAVDVEVALKCVPQTMPKELMQKSGMTLDQGAPAASPQELADYDAIIIGTPTRFGNMSSQMRSFLDQTGGLWAHGALIGKISSVFTSTATGIGNESTVLSTHITFLHRGVVVVGVPFGAPGIGDISEVHGGSFYGAGTIAGPDSSPANQAKKLGMDQFQGVHVARVTKN